MLNYPVAVTVCLVLIALNAWWGRRLSRLDAARERRYRRGLAIAMLVAWATVAGYYLWPTRFDPWHAWPLHICDIAALIGPLAMLTRVRLFRTILYFWGIGLTTQGFVTPVLEAGPQSMQYWLFWVNHTAVVGLAVYAVGVIGYRPRFNDLLAAIGFTACWACFVTPINLAHDLNYGYLGPTPPSQTRGTLVDLLGPWPLRMLWMAALVVLMFILLWAPWAIARRAATRPTD